MTTISVCMVVRNESLRIRDALDNVRPWVHEIVLVDQDSDDDTLAQAEPFGPVVIHETYKGYCEPDRRKAADAAHGDWILVQDADEVFTDQFLKELDLLVSSPYVDCYRLLRHTKVAGMPPFDEYQMRLYRRGKAEYSDHVHTEPIARGNVYNLDYTCIYHHKTLWEQLVDEKRMEAILDSQYANDPAYAAMKRLNFVTHPERGFIFEATP